MGDQYGGTPFSHFLGGSKKKSRNKNRNSRRKPKRQSKTKKRKTRTKKRNQQTQRLKGKTKQNRCKTCKCSCKDAFKGNEPSPKGLGFCNKCQPLNVIMRGKDGNIWKIEKIRNVKRWIKIT